VTSTAERVRSGVGVLGELLITAGVVVGLFALYTLFWTGVETSQAQGVLDDELQRQVASAETEVLIEDPLPGDAYARLRIPRLGEDWVWVVVEGVDLDDLRRGPGHYLDSADPGEVGNFAVAGHRATYGEPFADLDLLQPGDEILVEFGDTEYRYVATESFVTAPTDVDVVAPVPGQPSVSPTDAVITLTTCHPRWGSEERLIVHGVLVGSSRP
jgi:sortase A